MCLIDLAYVPDRASEVVLSGPQRLTRLRAAVGQARVGIQVCGCCPLPGSGWTGVELGDEVGRLKRECLVTESGDLDHLVTMQGVGLRGDIEASVA